MADVQYVFRSSGAHEVIRDFKRIGEAADEAGEKVSAVFRGGRRGAAGGNPQAAQRREQQQRIQSHERERKQRLAAVRRSEDRELRELERKLTNEARAEKRAAERRAKDKIRADKDFAKASVAVQKDLQRQTMALEGAKHKALEARNRAKAARDDVGRQRRHRFMRAGAGLGSDLAMAGGAMAIAVSAAALRQNVDNRDRARRIGINGGGDAKQILRGAENVSTSVVGATTGGVLGAQEAFVQRTGNLEAAQSFSKTIAEISVAANADIEDVSAAAANLFDKFDVRSIEQMEDALSALVLQGKRGSFELKDSAGQLEKLGAAAQRLGIGKGVESVKVLGGLTQIARSATGSPEQAATALEATFRQLTSRSGQLKAQGVRVFDGKGQARDIRDVLVETISKVGGTNIEKKKVGLQKIFGDEGIRAISPLISTYADTVAKGGNGEQAIRDQLADAISATGAYAEVQRDLAESQQQIGLQFEAAWDGMVAQIGNLGAPVVEGFSAILNSPEFKGALQQAAEAVAEFAGVMGVAFDVIEGIPVVGDALEAIRAKLRGDDSKPPEQKILEAQARIEERGQKRAGIMRGMAFDGSAVDKLSWQQMGDLDQANREDFALIDAAGRKRDSAQQLAGQALTEDQFVEQYIGASRFGEHEKGKAEIQARSALGSLREGLSADQLPDQTEDQKLIAQALAETMAVNRTRTDLGEYSPDAGRRTEDGAANGAFRGLVEAAEKAAAALNKIESGGSGSALVD